MGGDPRIAARARRRRRLLTTVATLAVAAVGLGALAGLDEVRERRADTALPQLAAELSRVLDERPELDGPFGIDGAGLAQAFLEESELELPEVGSFTFGETVGRLRGPHACVEQDPWLGGPRMRCLPLDGSRSEPRVGTFGGNFYVVGPDSAFGD